MIIQWGLYCDRWVAVTNHVNRVIREDKIGYHWHQVRAPLTNVNTYVRLKQLQLLKQLVEGSPSIIVIVLALRPRRPTHNLRVWSGKSINAEVKKWLTGQNRSKENTYKYVLFSIAHRYTLLHLCMWFLQPIHVLIFDRTGSVRSKRSDPHSFAWAFFSSLRIRSKERNTQSIGSSNEWASDSI